MKQPTQNLKDDVAKNNSLFLHYHSNGWNGEGQ